MQCWIFEAAVRGVGKVDDLDADNLVGGGGEEALVRGYVLQARQARVRGRLLPGPSLVGVGKLHTLSFS